jgi:hypothetical protein
MNKLANLAIDAHGGLDRWNNFTTLSVHGINGGASSSIAVTRLSFKRNEMQMRGTDRRPNNGPNHPNPS